MDTYVPVPEVPPEEVEGVVKSVVPVDLERGPGFHVLSCLVLEEPKLERVLPNSPSSTSSPAAGCD